MRLALRFLPIAMGVVSAGAFAPDPRPESARAAEIDAIFSDVTPQTPGCVVGVMHRGELLYSRAYGLADLEMNIPLRVDSVFSLESMSKQFTAMSVLLLADQRRLALSDDVRKYIPELRDYRVRITVADLLHHTSGLKDFNQLLSLAGVHGTDLVTNETAFEIVRRQPQLNFLPGTAFSYSDSNYLLLGMIVERVSGRPLADFARWYIFAPLGMSQTAFVQDRTKVISGAAQGYRKRSDGWHIGFTGGQAIGPSGVFSTVRDLAKWDRNFYHPRVGSEAVMRLMTGPARLKDGSFRGYGGGLEIARYRGLRVISHAGDGLGFQTAMIRFPGQDLSLVVLCNSRDFLSPMDLAESVANVYLKSAARPDENSRGEIAYNATAYQRFSGVYWDGKTDLLRQITITGGKLAQRLLPDDAPRALRRLSDGRFAGGNGITYTFAAPGRFLRVSPVDGQTVYHRIAEADLRSQEAGQFAGTFYAQSIDTRWQFLDVNHRLVLRRKGFPDEKLLFEFRDSFLGDLGLLQFLRDRAGHVDRLEVMNYRLGSVVFTRE